MGGLVEWRPIPGFSKYEASNFGYIRNASTKVAISAPVDCGGYKKIGVVDDENNRKTQRMHRLIALAFLPNPQQKQTVNHINHDKMDNRVCNLEWATVTEQNRHKRKCPREKQRLVSSRRVQRLDVKTGDVLQVYDTIRDAAEWIFQSKLTKVKSFNNGNNLKTKISAVCLKRCCTGPEGTNYIRKTAFGFGWSFVEDETFASEKWKPIPEHLIDDCKNEYQISSKGRVKNHKGRITTGHRGTSGYQWVSIHPKQFQLHRLVASTFLANPHNFPLVNHKDGNKTNNEVQNLEWATPQQNAQHAHDTKLNPISKSIKMVEKNLTFPSMAAATRWLRSQGKTLWSGALTRTMKNANMPRKAFGYTWILVQN
jgi:hypothetical protein